MIKKVTVTNPLGESVVLELRRPEKSGFLVQGIDGLVPCKAIINTTDMVTDDGSLYNSAHVSNRNIVFLLALLESPTIEDTRQNLYKYFPIKRRVNVKIETDNRICETYGYVESNEPQIFSRQESSNISIICPDAYFHSTKKDVTNFSNVVPLFEFPFSSEEAYIDDGNGRFMGALALTYSVPPVNIPETLIELSTIDINTEATIFYSGDATVGMLIQIHAIGPATNVRISNINTLESMSIDSARLIALTGADIHAGDDIIISTIKGNKYAVLERLGVLTNILNCINRDADWFQLEKGNNLFGYTADSGLDNLQFAIENQILYEGV